MAAPDGASESDAPSPDAAVPIARRIAASPVFYPLWLRGRAGPDARMPMVGWFDPRQLLTTGLKSLASLVVGERSDRRIVQALASRRQEYYDHSIHYRDGARGPQPDRTRPRDELWLDFICDTGDGWNSTYAVAFAAAQRSLHVHDGATAHDLPRGEVLVFGGDEVYPTPSREEYQRRLVAPYAAAFGDDQPGERPHVYAVPGNHDWYDGLSAFTRLFCSDIGGRRLAGWWTRQRRSYFVLKLPHRWWLVGSDGQLQSDLDVPQMEHFRDIAERHMQAGDKVILCLSQPVWVYAQKYRNMGRVFDETDLIYLREEVYAKRGIDVKVYLTGDLHHYRRHEETRESAGTAEPVQKITAGGGGAFLHPTHEDDFSRLREAAISEDVRSRTFEVCATYPSTAQSARLAWGNLLFLFKNPRFGVVPAAIYLMTAWLVGAASGGASPSNPWQALSVTVQAFSTAPGLALWCGAIVLGFFAFTDTHSRLYRVLGGLLHAVAHFTAMFYLGWGALDVAGRVFHASGVLRAALAGAGTFAGGWLAGSIIMGVYLLVSVNVFGRHSEEAFSGLRIEDFKHFLRLHVGADGRLTIWPVRIERVPRRWRPRAEGEATMSRVVPDEPFVAELIEPPIRIG
ncbi:MAG: metallophosphoesterase [Acidobacteria bacterium]|nr:metallophosphoesterase [Acidobacteriota bacterium]